MYVKYYGHACFSVWDNAKKIVIDPFGDIGYKQEQVQADFCLCTHFHYDHHSTQAVNAKIVVDDNNMISENWLSAIDSYHDEVDGQKRGKNTIYKILCDGMTVCHMGDIGMPISQDLVSKIGAVDILMIPIGGNYTIDAEQAKEYVLAIKPKIVIPMHYKTKRSDIDIDEKGQFLSYFSNVQKCPREFEISKKDLSNSMLVLDLDDSSF